MELHEFIGASNVVVQIMMGKQNIEFQSEVIGPWMEGILIKPYIFQNRPLELTITADSGVVCNLNGDDPITGKRVAFRNVLLSTEKRDNFQYYWIRAYGYNKVANLSERRERDRVEVRVRGRVTDIVEDMSHEALIHDVSDSGISFYAPSGFTPKSNSLRLEFEDTVEDRKFHLKVECKVVRTVQKVGTVFYGCALSKLDHDYQIYTFLQRMKGKEEKQGDHEPK